MTNRGGERKDPTTSTTDPAIELKQQRDSFVQTFFRKGAEFTEELLRENERLRKQKLDLEGENAALRTQLASDAAMRDLLRKIEQLEQEKQSLLSRMTQQEAASTHFTERQTEMEEELNDLANLYVASYQLHSTLRLQEVLRHLRELLAQLVGARSHAYYLANRERTELRPVSSDGVAIEALPVVTIGVPGDDATAATLDRTFVTGVPFIREHEAAASGLPVACLPMRIDETVVGVIVLYELLDQKPSFVPVDFELFKMLGAHAATALVAALLSARAGGDLPGAEAFSKLERR